MSNQLQLPLAPPSFHVRGICFNKLCFKNLGNLKFLTFIDKLPTDQHQEKMTDDVEQMSDVELSSDSEAENIENEDGVSLVIFKRPPLKTRTVEEVEVRDLLRVSN